MFLRGCLWRRSTSPASLERIYMIRLVSDHYPAESFEARKLLKYEATETVSPLFVMDVFALDAMTEMLSLTCCRSRRHRPKFFELFRTLSD